MLITARVVCQLRKFDRRPEKHALESGFQFHFALNSNVVLHYFFNCICALPADFGEVKTAGIYSRKSAHDDSSACISQAKCCCADDVIQKFSVVQMTHLLRNK